MDALGSRAQLLQRARVDLTGQIAAGVASAALVTAVASADGGYAATSWGWTALAAAWIGAIALVLRDDVAVARLQLVAPVGLAALALWTLLSATWSGDAGASVLSFQRLLVYVAAVGGALVAFRADAYPGLVAGTWAGTTLASGYGLLTRLYPNSFPPPNAIAGNRLAPPIGYWNGLGLFAAIGLLLALGLVASRRRVLAPLAAASAVPLSLTLYFTFSRGGWLAGGVALAAALALDPLRTRLALAVLVIGPWCAGAIALAVRDKSLSTVSAPPPDAARVGAHLAHQSALLALGAALCGVALVELARRVHAGPRATRAGSLALAAVAVGLVVAGAAELTARYGSPASVVRKTWHSFTQEHANTSNDLNARFFSFSGTGRVDLWRVAWHDFTAHPLRGSGAGTYQREWLAQRPDSSQVVNAHQLYLETAAELGLPGLLLLLVALAAPLAAAWRARDRALVPVAAAAYVAFLVHALFDWDWQLPGVTLAALLPAVAVLLAAGRPAQPGARVRYGAVGALGTLAVVAALGLVGNRAAASAARLTAHAEYARAAAAARHAARWQPWSSRPWRLLGENQVQQGDFAAARASFGKAIAKDRQDWQLWLDLATAERGRAARRAALDRAAALNPRSIEIAAVRKALGL